jgi:4-amino-4-deoxy-L-arabinose transferase-like glycosyltransferase
LVRSFIYASFVPPWQGPDEPLHYDYIHYLQVEKKLPVLGEVVLCKKVRLSLASFYFDSFIRGTNPYLSDKQLNTKELPIKDVDDVNHTGTSSQQRNQIIQHPPLYYVLMAILTWPFKDASLFTQIWLIRMLSALLGLGVIIFTYLSFETIFEKNRFPAFGAAAFVALNPMFVHDMALINNDALTNFLFAFFIYLFIKGIKEGFELKRVSLIGVVIGLGLLTKFFFFIALPFMLFGLVLFRKRLLPSYRVVALSIFVPLLVSAPYYLRNIFLYGTVQPIFKFKTLDNALFAKMSFVKYLIGSAFKRKLVYSFWSNFGWTSPRFSEEFYRILKIFPLFVVVGLVFYLFHLVRKKDFFKLKLLTLLSSAPIMLVLPLAYNSYKNARMTGVVEGVQGRYLFLLIGIFGLLMYLGIRQLLPVIADNTMRRDRLALAIVVGGMAILDISAIFYYILPYFYF